MIKLFACDFAVQDWAKCDGQSMSSTKFEDTLFELFGTTYGGNGTSAFKLPDIKAPWGGWGKGNYLTPTAKAPFPQAGSGTAFYGYTGQVELFGGNVVPAGWMKCEGQVLNVSDYAALAGKIGNKFGGDGSSTFALPDTQGKEPLAGTFYCICVTGGEVPK